MQDAIIAGGGITGLTTGYLLQEKGLDVSIIEKGPQPGGSIQSVSADGYLYEKGAHSLHVSDPWINEFITGLGLGSEIVEPGPEARNTLVARSGRLAAAPASLWQALTTPLFSIKAKFGLLGEPFRAPASPDLEEEESVAGFAARRLGREILDYAVDPYIRGLYGGDPSALNLSHAFPSIRKLERDSGSLALGAWKRQRRSRRQGMVNANRLVSFSSGLDALPKTISRKLGNRLWLGSEVVAVNRLDSGWQATWKREGENFEGFARNLVICLPSFATKALVWPSPIDDWLSGTPDLPYTSLRRLAFGFPQNGVENALKGSGVLVPSKEPYRILEAQFSSSLYPRRAPDGCCLIRATLGAYEDDEFQDASETDLLAVAIGDLRELIGANAEPVFHHTTRWPRAIPQYTNAFGAWKSALLCLEDDYPGLYFGGHAKDGIAMDDGLLSGRRIAQAIHDGSL